MTAASHHVVGHPRRIRFVLDGVFALLALAIFGQVADPDILFHGIWVVLTLQAFLFGLHVTIIRIGVAMVLLVAYFTIGASAGPGEPGLLQLDLAEWPLMILIAVLMAVMADRVASTGRHYADLYRRASDRLLTAQEDERKRLGLDLHDGVGQTLTALTLTLDAAESLSWAGERAPSTLSRGAIQRAQELAAIAVEDTHDVALRLRPSRFVEGGLEAALSWLGSSTGVPVTVTADADLPRSGLLRPDDEMNVYRVVQEALNNSIRHAQARSIRIDLTADASTVTVTITDDGIGFDAAKAIERGVGLAGMRERAIVLGAQFELESTPGAGSRISLRVPRVRPDAGGGRPPARTAIARQESTS